MRYDDYDTGKYRDRLIACPFCGPSHEIPLYMHRVKEKHMKEFIYFVECSNCGCGPNFYVETEEEAIILWNTRAELTKSENFTLGFESARNQILKIVEQLRKGS